MSMSRTPSLPEHVNGVFLRAIGRLSLASWELDALRCAARGAESGSGAWSEFADHLARTADSVREAAVGSSFPGDTISVLREGARVAVDPAYVDRLCEKIHRHVKVARALGIGEATPESELASMGVSA